MILADPDSSSRDYGVPTGTVPRRVNIEHPNDADCGRQKINPATPIVQQGAYNKPGAAVKADAGKIQWALLPFKYLRGVVRVLMFGAKKYSADNWRRGMPWSQPYNAAIRHLDAWMNGEDIDPETEESHIDHALCCLLFLRAYIQDHPGLDDRFKA